MVEQPTQPLSPPTVSASSSSSSSSFSGGGDDPHTALTKCLFSQYGFTFASVSLATAYSIYRRPKNGMGIMLMTGATGTIVDFLYGYMVTCSKEVLQSQEYYIQQQQQKQDVEKDNDPPR